MKGKNIEAANAYLSGKSLTIIRKAKELRKARGKLAVAVDNTIAKLRRWVKAEAEADKAKEALRIAQDLRLAAQAEYETAKRAQNALGLSLQALSAGVDRAIS